MKKVEIESRRAHERRKEAEMGKHFPLGLASRQESSLQERCGSLPWSRTKQKPPRQLFCHDLGLGGQAALALALIRTPTVHPWKNSLAFLSFSVILSVLLQDFLTESRDFIVLLLSVGGNRQTKALNQTLEWKKLWPRNTEALRKNGGKKDKYILK